ncbi:MAG: SpoIID/LytB domain-containing protein, partial [Pyrinomonadaceae bacterium]
LAITLALSPFLPTHNLAAQENRERKAGSGSQPAWTVPTSADAQQRTELGPEPTVRVGLATDMRSVTISTTGQLMNASALNTAPVPLEATRVRIESRYLSPPAVSDRELYRVELAGSFIRDEAERFARQVKDVTDVEVEMVNTIGTNLWRVVAGQRPSREEAEELRARLDEAGFALAPITSTTGALSRNVTNAPLMKSESGRTSAGRSAPVGTVRPVLRTSSPTRELVAFARGVTPLLKSSAPIAFGSNDENSAPVRFNDKPYRGRLEVFANTRGSLTVVNVIGLEDYVKGVVPNELSPGGYPAIEALKAQAIAARTYALKNKGQFASSGFDILPTIRSQVYRGLSSEHPLSSRAVDETRGVVATYEGEPINALYTSTCGGRTENSENIFNDAIPYLRGRECGAEGKAAFEPFMVKSSRDLPEIKDAENAAVVRDFALLAVHSFALPQDAISDSWLGTHVTAVEIRNWLGAVALLAKQAPPSISDEAIRPGAFSTALLAAVFGETRADVLLNNADVDYLLAFRDAEQLPPANRADVAMLLRDGYLSLYPDTTLRPREAMTRARVLHPIARLLETRGLLQLQRGTTRPANAGAMILRSNKGKDLPLVVGREAYLLRQLGEALYQMRSIALVGGEPVTFHVNARGEVDYLEVKPAVNGASAERSSPYTNWTNELSVGEVQSRLARSVRGIGPITDLRVMARGSSRRAIDLAVIGSEGTAHVRGGRIRSALGLREQLFIIDRRYDTNGRVTGFIFTGRGWGHGVGMCQVGAYGLAKLGWSYDRILKNYYSGIDLTRLY